MEKGPFVAAWGSGPATCVRSHQLYIYIYKIVLYCSCSVETSVVSHVLSWRNCAGPKPDLSSNTHQHHSKMLRDTAWCELSTVFIWWTWKIVTPQCRSWVCDSSWDFPGLMCSWNTGCSSALADPTSSTSRRSKATFLRREAPLPVSRGLGVR